MKILFVPNVNIAALDDATVARIQEAGGPDTEVMRAASAGEALELIGDADVVLGQITPDLLRRGPSVRWMQLAAAGADVYFTDEIRASGMVLTSDKGLVGNQLAQQAFALLLGLTRRTAQSMLDAPHSWDHRLEYRGEVFELSGKTMGILGFGGTGKAIAKLAAAFGMQVIAVDVEPDVQPTDEVPEVWGAERTDELLQTADVVASGLPLTPHTRGFFNERAFSLMKPTAILINVTRGELVDGDALAEAVSSGKIAGAGLDVAPIEPLPPEHPLWTTRNVLITPHIAGGSQFRMPRLLDRFVRNVAHLAAGEPLEGVIDKDKGY